MSLWSFEPCSLVTTFCLREAKFFEPLRLYRLTMTNTDARSVCGG